MDAKTEMLRDLKVYSNTLYTGQTIRINHNNCPSGTDAKRRFYITRKPDVLLGYCHNCGNSVSYYVAKEDRYRWEDSTAPLATIAREYEVPVQIGFSESGNIPTEAVTWRIQNRLLVPMCDDNEISFNPDYFGICTPVYNMEHRIGYQIRPLVQRGPKYITLLKDDYPMGGYKKSSASILDNVPVVIAEDWVSATHINSTGYVGYCNYGVQTKPNMLHALVKTLGRERPYIIWLDNDSPTITMKAREIGDILGMFGATTYMVTDKADPKHYTSGQIYSTVGGIIK